VARVTGVEDLYTIKGQASLVALLAEVCKLISNKIDLFKGRLVRASDEEGLQVSQGRLGAGQMYRGTLPSEAVKAF